MAQGSLLQAGQDHLPGKQAWNWRGMSLKEEQFKPEGKKEPCPHKEKAPLSPRGLRNLVPSKFHH